MSVCLERRQGQIDQSGAVARGHDFLRDFSRRHFRFEAVQQDFVHDQQVRRISDRFRGHHIVHRSLHGRNHHVAAHEALVECDHGQVFVLVSPKQIGDFVDGQDGSVGIVFTVVTEAAAVVLHDQRVVVGAADLHAPVQECFQCRDVASVPLFLFFQILGIHVSIGVHAVEIHPLHGDRAAVAVADPADAGVGPIPLRRAVAFMTVHEHIDFHVFGQDGFLHVQELSQISAFQVVVARQVDEEAPRVVLRIVGIRQALCDQAVFAVFVVVRRVHGQVVFALLQPGETDLGILAFLQYIAVGVLEGIGHTVFPVAAVIREDDLAAFPRIVFQHDLERVRARFVLLHGLRDGEPRDRLVFADGDRLHALVAVRRDQA